MIDATAANASWPEVNSAPGAPVVNDGSTRLSTASVQTVASAVAVPSALNDAVPWRRAPISSEIPTMPFVVIITAANTVSRASVDVSSPPEIISVTISATSITVTATASTSEPNGSPTRCATTSAWCTAASTAPARNAPAITRTIVPGLLPQLAAVSTAASTGTTVVQRGVPKRAIQDGSPLAASRCVVGRVDPRGPRAGRPLARGRPCRRARPSCRGAGPSRARRGRARCPSRPARGTRSATTPAAASGGAGRRPRR